MEASHYPVVQSGPAELPRRLVAYQDRVYVTLGIQAPLTALDAATGEILHSYEDTAGTEEILLDDKLLLVRVTDAPARSAKPPVEDTPSRLMALEALPYAGNPERYSIPVAQQPEHAHLFCPTGFLDDSGWHRTYWVYGKLYLSTVNGTVQCLGKK